MAFLDNTGLSHLWSKITSALSGKLDTTGNAYRAASIPFAQVDSTSTNTAFTATVPGITELRDGVCMWLRNGKVTSASGFTININGLGAKPCYSSLAAATRSTTIFNVNYTLLFVYNSARVSGGCWDIVYGVDSNTTYNPPKLGFGYAVCTTAAATAAKTASISSYALTTGGIVSIHFDNDVPSGATLNISSKGAKAIYYRGAAITDGVSTAGDTATFVYSPYYHLISRSMYIPNGWFGGSFVNPRQRATSPCVDAGDPAFDASHEPHPAKRINMGAYGGTPWTAPTWYNKGSMLRIE
jgi:hypothetical protein